MGRLEGQRRLPIDSPIIWKPLCLRNMDEDSLLHIRNEAVNELTAETA